MSPRTLVVLALGCAPVLQAQDTTARRLPPVVVTREAGRSPTELPYAISTMVPDSVAPGQTHTLPEQTLSLIPGLTVANRNNPSQDARISIRGFGARSAFGVRSLRILRDGMPLTLPDGQTPIDYLDLETVGRVETIRGTASALYGNASGGVVDLRSSPPPSAPFAAQLRSWAGSYGMRRYVGLFGGTASGVAYSGNIGRTLQDGYRAYATQKLTNAFVRASADVGGTELALIGMGLDMPVAENPGALTQIQYDTNPRMADPLSIQRRARKEVHQVQLGLSARRPMRGTGEVVAQAYGSGRSLFNPLTFAVVDVERRSSGGALRATLPFGAGALSQRFTVGVDAQQLNDLRKNWANCNGVAAPTANCVTLPAEKGRLQLDQRELVTSVGPYVRDELELGRVRATLGVRADRTTFELRDFYTDPVTADGRDDSGKRTMSAVSPMGALAVSLARSHAVYANVSSAFETPTTTELGNQADGSAGLNRDLNPQYSTTYEVGLKGFALARLQYDLALFNTNVRDELIPFDIGNGRTAFRNAGRTNRRGAEVSLGTEYGPFAVNTTYTHSHFRFRDFVSGTSQFAGNAIPGIPEHQVQAIGSVRTRFGYGVAEWMAKSKVYVNDANGAAAAGYGIVNARIGATAAFGRPWLSPVFGVQNLFDRKYVGSIAVNAAGTIATAKFYEPGAGRTFFAGLSAATAPW